MRGIAIGIVIRFYYSHSDFSSYFLNFDSLRSCIEELISTEFYRVLLNPFFVRNGKYFGVTIHFCQVNDCIDSIIVVISGPIDCHLTLNEVLTLKVDVSEQGSSIDLLKGVSCCKRYRMTLVFSVH